VKSRGAHGADAMGILRGGEQELHFDVELAQWIRMGCGTHGQHETRGSDCGLSLAEARLHLARTVSTVGF
jgi:hypothetical protein